MCINIPACLRGDIKKGSINTSWLIHFSKRLSSLSGPFFEPLPLVYLFSNYCTAPLASESTSKLEMFARWMTLLGELLNCWGVLKLPADSCPYVPTCLVQTCFDKILFHPEESVTVQAVRILDRGLLPRDRFGGVEGLSPHAEHVQKPQQGPAIPGCNKWGWGHESLRVP